MKLYYWVVRVVLHPPKSVKPMPEYSAELGAAYVADVAPALVRRVELGEYCVLPDYSIAEVLRDMPDAAFAKAYADEIRAKRPEWDVRELVTAE